MVPRSTFTPATSTCCSPSIMTNSFDANLRPPRIPVEDDIRRQPDGDGPVPVAAHQRDIERVFFVERVLDHPHAGDEELTAGADEVEQVRAEDGPDDGGVG